MNPIFCRNDHWVDFYKCCFADLTTNQQKLHFLLKRPTNKISLSNRKKCLIFRGKFIIRNKIRIVTILDLQKNLWSIWIVHSHLYLLLTLEIKKKHFKTCTHIRGEQNTITTHHGITTQRFVCHNKMWRVVRLEPVEIDLVKFLPSVPSFHLTTVTALFAWTIKYNAYINKLSVSLSFSTRKTLINHFISFFLYP